MAHVEAVADALKRVLAQELARMEAFVNAPMPVEMVPPPDWMPRSLVQEMAPTREKHLHTLQQQYRRERIDAPEIATRRNAFFQWLKEAAACGQEYWQQAPEALASLREIISPRRSLAWAGEIPDRSLFLSGSAFVAMVALTCNDAPPSPERSQAEVDVATRVLERMAKATSVSPEEAEQRSDALLARLQQALSDPEGVLP